MLNSVVLMGRLVAAPELRTTTSGNSVTSFNLAVDRYRVADGKRETDFIHCVAWRQTAEFITKWFDKGRMIAVEGRLQQRKYTDKQGIERDVIDVLVEKVNFSGDKKTETARETKPDEEREQETLNDLLGNDLPF